MSAIKISRKIHKWVALILGIQLFLWALSGFYMVAVHLDIIHGDMLVKKMKQDIGNDVDLYLSLDQLAINYPKAQSITLKSVAGRPAFLINGENTLLLDASNGRRLSPIDEETATLIANYHYAGEGAIRRIELLESNPPMELQSRSLPLWRVDFDDVWNSSFYIDPNTGQFKTRRHTLWRVFDFLWMLHVMDYDERENVNNNVLRVFSVLGTFLGLSGIWLLFYSFRKSSTTEAVL